MLQMSRKPGEAHRQPVNASRQGRTPSAKSEAKSCEEAAQTPLGGLGLGPTLHEVSTAVPHDLIGEFNGDCTVADSGGESVFDGDSFRSYGNSSHMVTVQRNR